VFSGNAVKTITNYQLLQTDCPNNASLPGGNQRLPWIVSSVFSPLFLKVEASILAGLVGV